MPTETRSLHSKLAEVMAEAERIPKNGTAPSQMGGFKFVQVGDAADAIRRMLGERHISMLPSAVEVVGESEHETRSGGTMTTLTIRTTWTLVDGESGETATIQSLGTGADTGDKYSPKAQTNAMKYALLMGFLLSTGDDPEQTDTSDRKRTRVLTAKDGVVPQKDVAPPDRDPGGITGTVEVGTPGAKSDYEIRYGPDGRAHLGFRLISDRGGIKVTVEGRLAEDLSLNRAAVVGERVTAWGRIADETFRPKGAKRDVTYQVLTLERIKAPLLELPKDDVVPGQEVLPLTDEEKAAIAKGGE